MCNARLREQLHFRQIVLYVRGLSNIIISEGGYIVSFYSTFKRVETVHTVQVRQLECSIYGWILYIRFEMHANSWNSRKVARDARDAD